MYGVLKRRSDILRDDSWFGVSLRTECNPTRWEEYTFVRDVLGWGGGRTLLDSGTGFDPTIHLLGPILARAGWRVTAVDQNRRVSSLPSHPNVRYVVGDMFDIPVPDNSFDAAVCVSVLEHMDHPNRLKALGELRRALKPGGTLVVTMDGDLPEDVFSDWDLGEERVEAGPELGPRVSFVVSVK